MSDHPSRRAAILKMDPSVRCLEGVEWRSKYLGAGVACLHLVSGVWASRLDSWVAQVVVAYSVGGTCVQALFLAIHECTHGLFFSSPRRNMAFAIFVLNSPILVPFAVSFRGYHLAHHRCQGVQGEDTDLPSEWEKRNVVGPLRKLLWLSNQLLAYAIRPVLVKPERATASHAVNVVWQLCVNTLLVRLFGWECVRYFLLCVWLSGGVHPCAGHFLSEHYTQECSAASQDTFSYYGPLNSLTWNVGYHNEHHDFPRVPWSRLPEVRRRGGCMYSDLRTVPSWPGLLVDFVFDSKWSLRCRREGREKRRSS